MKLPNKFETMLTKFQKNLVCKALRMDKIKQSLVRYVGQVAGQKFVESPPFDLNRAYMDSCPETPILFLLSPGSDPFGALLRFAESRQVKIEAISLGQGQAPAALKAVKLARKNGHWVCLQNCHLAPSFMSALETLCANAYSIR